MTVFLKDSTVDEKTSLHITMPQYSGVHFPCLNFYLIKAKADPSISTYVSVPRSQSLDLIASITQLTRHSSLVLSAHPLKSYFAMVGHIRVTFSRFLLLVLVTVITQSSASFSNPKTPPVTVRGNGMWLLKRGEKLSLI